MLTWGELLVAARPVVCLVQRVPQTLCLARQNGPLLSSLFPQSVWPTWQIVEIRGRTRASCKTSHKPHLLHHLPVRLFRALHLRRLLMPFLVCQVPLQFQQCLQCLQFLQYRLHLWCPQYLQRLWFRLLPQHLLVIKGSKFKSKIVATCYNLWLIKTT